MRMRAITVVLGAAVIASCGGGESNGVESLPLLTAAPVSSASAAATSTTVAAVEEYYTIQQGDTLFGIAKSFSVTLDDLIAYNGITDPDAIEAGQRLKIPPVGASIPTTAASTTTTTTP